MGGLGRIIIKEHPKRFLSIQMRTVIVTAPGNVAIIDTPVPVVGPYEALVRTELACVCNNTDGELVGGKFTGMEAAFPFALGHESVGKVARPAILSKTA